MDESNGWSEAALWQRDPPYWARVLIGGLLVITSWWALSAGVARSAVGSSVAVVVLGIVSASSLRGMHIPLGLWPDGPWRRGFSIGVVVLVAVVFGTLMVVADPRSDAVLAQVDRGVFTLTVIGVVGWGITWSLVRQGGFAGWFGVATAAGLAPFIVGVLESGTVADGGVCLFGLDASRQCAGSMMRAFGFLLPAYAAMTLITIELTFRRLLIGMPAYAETPTVVASGLLFAAWTALVGVDVPLFAVPWWTALLAALSAGALYVLGGSLLVSSLFTGLLYAGYFSLVVGSSANTAAGPGLAYSITLALVTSALVGLVIRQRGLRGRAMPFRSRG